MKSSCVSLSVALSILAIGPVQAQEIASLQPAYRAPQYMRVYANAQPPYGFVRFCEVQPNECVSTAVSDDRYPMTPERLSNLDEINRAVNREIEPATDGEIYGVNELWTVPKVRGDCEDFAIAKYFTLLDLGIDEHKLTLTYVKALKLNQAHMVLTYYPSPKAEPLVLDNLVEAILPSSERTDLLPVYSLNGSGLWLARQRGRGKMVGDSSRLQRWQEMLARMTKEFNQEIAP